MAEETFVDDVRGGVLETERVKQARREEVQWCRGMGVWEPALRGTRMQKEPKQCLYVGLTLTRAMRIDQTTGLDAELEADTRHVAMVLRDQGLEKATPVVTPLAKRSKSEELLLLAGAKHLNAEDTTLYKSVTMHVNFSSLDSPDFSFAAGSLARGMKSTTTKYLEELKCVGRYLRGRPVGAIEFEPQTLPGALEVFCDADHARESRTRKSRSGMAVMWRLHWIKHGSAVQSTSVEQWRV